MSVITLNKVETKWYGWKPDKPDFRDHHYSLTGPFGAKVPTTNRTTFVMPPVVDQGNLGSCTGNGIAGLLMFNFLNHHVQNKTRSKVDYFSRLFIYYGERVIEGSVKEDAGAEIRDGIKVVDKLGAPPEHIWPYTISKFANKPTKTAFIAALKFKAVNYERINNTNPDLLYSAIAAGKPVVYGFTVYDSFESDRVARTGIVPMPKSTERVLGGHCVWMIDYDEVNGVPGYWSVNSWGIDWGFKGLFFMPEAYVTNNNLADDFWTITTIL
jgi:C1A family cysteine protease